MLNFLTKSYIDRKKNNDICIENLDAMNLTDKDKNFIKKCIIAILAFYIIGGGIILLLGIISFFKY